MNNHVMFLAIFVLMLIAIIGIVMSLPNHSIGAKVTAIAVVISLVIAGYGTIREAE
jgi:hypothetical protein